jgi:cytidylate kinase
MKSQISIDGPAASGKTSIGRKVSSHLKFRFLDTGLMYRAATWIVIKNNIDINNEFEIASSVTNSNFSINSNLKEDSLFIDSYNVISELRTSEIDKYVSQVSKILKVREILVNQQRSIAASGNIVMVGRDIGSVVLPNADIKIYLDASLEIRAKRRFEEVKGSTKLSFKEIKQDLEKRDIIDSNRKISPLTIPEDATVVNTDNLTISQVIEKIISIVEI